jgi:lysozyme family protein
MANDNFKKCLEIILHHEGGYVDHPKDPGGATNLGVTKQTYEDWMGKVVTKDVIKALTEADVTPIYKKNYWNAILADDIPAGLDLCVFDMCVNGGRHRATKMLQQMVGAKIDGWIGPNTINMTKGYVESNGITKAIEEYQKIRQDFYESLATFKTFGKGWTRRVNETKESALAMTK